MAGIGTKTYTRDEVFTMFNIEFTFNASSS